MKPCIEIKNVSKTYDKKTVLKSLSLTVEEGEILGFLGPSGAGKTTLIKILTGQTLPTKGEAYVFQKEVRALTRECYEKIGMLLDDSGLYERLTCFDNLLLFAQIYGIPKKRIVEVLEEVDLLDAKKRPVHQLSKGMKQRLIFARALLHKPKLLFLDEPTSGLDPVTTARMHALIDNQKAAGTTIFLTTHNMQEAYKLCDHVALLHQGKLVEYGEPSMLCKKYNTKPEISLLLKSGETLIFPHDFEQLAPMFDYFKHNQVESIHSLEPNLETIFLSLTGKELS
ncbi:MAG: type transport system ATP-binding protein [Clostridiales bacterium]|nr:type transport system ATP-binding protein [Clostridiales bacterium]